MMSIEFGAEIEITNPLPKTIDWIKKNLWVENPDYVNKLKLGKWTGNTPPKLLLYRRNGDSWFIPAGYRDLFSKTNHHTAYEDKSANYVLNIDTDEPFDWQRKALDVAKKSPYGGIIVSGCGTGKTSVGIWLLGELQQRALWLTHTDFLCRQAMGRFKSFYGGEGMGHTTAGKLHIGTRITFATVQTLVKYNPQYYANEFGVCIVDEAHRLAGTVQKATMFSKVLSNLNCRYKYGLTALLHRADGLEKCTTAHIGDVIWETSRDEVIKASMSAVVQRVGTALPPSEEYEAGDGTLQWAKLLNYIALNERRNKQIADDIIQARERKRVVLVLSDRREQLQLLYGLLPDELKDVTRILVGGNNKKNAKLMNELRDGTATICLATYQYFREGADVKPLDYLIFGTPAKDESIITQSTGRICRLLDGKPTPVIRDYVDDGIRYLQRMYTERCKIYRKLGYEISRGLEWM